MATRCSRLPQSTCFRKRITSRLWPIFGPPSREYGDSGGCVANQCRGGPGALWALSALVREHMRSRADNAQRAPGPPLRNAVDICPINLQKDKRFSGTKSTGRGAPIGRRTCFKSGDNVTSEKGGTRMALAKVYS